jgi:glycosyltransferase involved in cell wall biosynthesis
MNGTLSKYVFTVFTPTYNRAHTLHRVYCSLKRQTFQDFEWLIVDDGSNDGTCELVALWKREAPFKIRYFHQENLGKHVAINRGAEHARGELFLIADSDDSFESNTLERFFWYWSQLTKKQRKQCAGVACLVKNGYNGKLSGKKHDIVTPAIVHELPYNLKFKRDFESWGVLRSDILLKYPFPEINSIKFIPEGFVWNKICRIFPRVVTNEVLRNVYHQNDGFSINTRLNYYRYAKGFYAYYRFNLYNNADLLLKYSPIQLIKQIIQMHRVAIHSKISFMTTWKRIATKPIIACLFYPLLCIGYILAILDRKYFKIKDKIEECKFQA